MECELVGCERLMAALATLGERMNGYEIELSRTGLFGEVTGCAELRYYRNGWALERYTEAYRKKDGGCLCWWFDLRCRDSVWIVHYWIAFIPKGGPQETLYDFDDLCATTLNDLCQNIEKAVAELIKHREVWSHAET